MQKPVKANYHPARFGGLRQCDSGDIKILVFHVILQDQVVKGCGDFIGTSLSW